MHKYTLLKYPPYTRIEDGVPTYPPIGFLKDISLVEAGRMFLTYIQPHIASNQPLPVFEIIDEEGATHNSTLHRVWETKYKKKLAPILD